MITYEDREIIEELKALDFIDKKINTEFILEQLDGVRQK